MVLTKQVTLSICILVVLLLDLGFASAVEEPKNLDAERAKCAEKLARRKERLESFNLTFTDPRQANFFKYLSAKSFGRPAPISAFEFQLEDFPHYRRITWNLPKDLIFYEMLYSMCQRPEEFQHRIKLGSDCEVRGWNAYKEVFQKIRDLHIDCWRSGEYLKYLDEKLTILPMDRPNITDSSGLCYDVFNNTKFLDTNEGFFKEVEELEACDDKQWKTLTNYKLSCHREKPVRVDMTIARNMIVSLEEIGDEINSLFDLRSRQMNKNDIFYLKRDQIIFRSGELKNFFTQPHNHWEGHPFFESIHTFSEVVRDSLSNLVSNATSEVRFRAFHLWTRAHMEMVNLACSQSELESYYTKNRYHFDTNEHDLLKLVKAAGINWRFKYVHLEDNKAFGLNINNEKLFGMFIHNPELPANSTIERVRRLLNSLIQFYWDVMATRGNHPVAPGDDDYAVTCRYKKLYDEDAQSDIYDSGSLNRIIIHHKPESPDIVRLTKFEHVLSLVGDFQAENISNENLDDNDIYLKIAKVIHETFKNTSEFKRDVYLPIKYLLMELSGVKNRSPVFYPEFVYEDGFASKCKEVVHCEFLLSFHMIGAAFDLMYVNKDSQEVFANEPGLFVYFQSDEEPPASRNVRFLLNYLLDKVPR